MSLANDSELSFAQQNILVANASGNVGIGMASPTSKLHIGAGTSQTNIAIDGNGGASYNGLLINTAGAQKWFLGRNGADGTDDFILRANGSANVMRSFGSGAVADTLVLNSGKVGIGIQSPTHTLEVAGTIHASGAITGTTISATYQDVAEWVPSTQRLSAGTVVVLDTGKTNHVVAATKQYDTGVAGVVSDSPGVILGVGGEDKLKIATTGRVRVRVDATRGAVKVGDLLVTSDVEGVAMKSIEVDLGGVKIHRPGTIIGKALEPLASGTGEILVLLSLQ
jgi:Peptidase_G2, IMC autoproteolytic cleavage domain